MAGPLTIQRYPRGLLDLLGSKSSGENPTDLVPAVQGTIDLSYMYQFEKVELVNATTNVVNLTGAWGVTGTAFTVPAGELWLLHNLTVTANAQLAAGESYRIRAAIFRAQWTNWQLGSDTGVGSGVGTRPSIGWQFERPEILRPSDSVGLFAEQVAAGASQFTAYGYITRLKI